MRRNWQFSRDVGNVTEFTLRNVVVIDNYFFGVASVSKDGFWKAQWSSLVQQARSTCDNFSGVKPQAKALRCGCLGFAITCWTQWLFGFEFPNAGN